MPSAASPPHWPARRAPGRAAASFTRAGSSPPASSGPSPERGARVASLHPVQSFPRKDVPSSVFEGITWGLEGDAAAFEEAEGIVRALRGNVLLLSAKDKAIYHAACALASNALVALEWTAAEVLGKAGVPEEDARGMLVPLVQGTLQNVKSFGLEKALTGPVVRGDVATVRKHLEALEGDPAAREVYAVLGKQILRPGRAAGTAGGTRQSIEASARR